MVSSRRRTVRRLRVPGCVRTAALALAALVAGLPPSVKAEAPESGVWTRGRTLDWSPTAQATNAQLRYRAVVIGINRYGSPRGGLGWRDLATAAQDAEAVAETLERDYGFEVKTLIDRDATREAIMVALDELASLTVDDAALVYFAGHGTYDERLGEGYWIPYGARKEVDGRLTKEDWLWHTTVGAILGGSRARHILVMADSCYAGALFRGDARAVGNADLEWYRRVNAKPSRYLITSGDFEPVVDSGKRHSVFAQHVLGYLRNPERSIFSASDLGVAVRREVSARTGQMVRMGPVPVPAHAGGEFVFIRKTDVAAE